MLVIPTLGAGEEGEKERGEGRGEERGGEENPGEGGRGQVYQEHSGTRLSRHDKHSVNSMHYWNHI